MKVTDKTLRKAISCLLVACLLLPVQLTVAFAEDETEAFQNRDRSHFVEMVDPALVDRELSIKNPFYSDDYLQETYDLSLDEYNAGAGSKEAAESVQSDEQDTSAGFTPMAEEEGLLEYPPYVPHYDKYEPVAINPQAYTEDIIANGRVPQDFDGYSWATATTTNEFEYLRPADTYSRKYLKKPRVTLAAADFAGVFMPADKTAVDFYKGNYTADSGFFRADGKLTFKGGSGAFAGGWEKGTYLGDPYDPDYTDPRGGQNCKSEFNFLLRQNESNTAADYDQRNAVVVDSVPETLSKPASVSVDFADNTKFYARIGLLTVGSKVGFQATVHFSDGSSKDYRPGYYDYWETGLGTLSSDLNMISLENATGTSDPGYRGGDPESVGIVEMDEVYFDSTVDSGRKFHVYDLNIPDTKRLLAVTGVTITSTSAHAPVYVLGFCGYKSEILNPPNGFIDLRVVDETDRSITLSWLGKKFDTGREWDSKFSHYYIDVATDRNFTNILYTRTISNAPETTRNYEFREEFDQLQPGTQYFFRAGTKLITGEKTLTSTPSTLSIAYSSTIRSKKIIYAGGNTDPGKYGLSGAAPVDDNYYSLEDVVTIAQPDPGFQLYLLSNSATTYRFLGWVSKFGYTYQPGDQVKMSDLTNAIGDGTLTAKWDNGAAPTAVQPAGSGDSEADPYRLETPDNLLWVMQQSKTNATVFHNKYFKLMNNIDMSNAPTNLTSPIGFYRTWVRYPLVNCVFDGNYKTISNLKLKNSNNDTMAFGLFGGVQDSVIKNLTVQNINIDAYVFTSYKDSDNAGFLYTGGIVGLADNSIVENCKVTGDSFIMAVGCKVMAGGVIGATDYRVGVNDNSKKPYVLKNVGVDSDVELYVSNVWGNLEKGYHAFLYAGGLIGYVDSHYSAGDTRIIINDCYNKALIKAYPEKNPHVAFPYDSTKPYTADGNRAVTNTETYHHSGIGGLVGGQTEVWGTTLEIRRAFNTGLIQVVNQLNLTEEGGHVYTGALVGHSGNYGRYAFGSTSGFFVKGTVFYTDDPGYVTVDEVNHTVALNGSSGSVTTNRPFGNLALSAGEERLVADHYCKTLVQLQTPDTYQEDHNGDITPWDTNIWKLTAGALPGLNNRYSIPTSMRFESFDQSFDLDVGDSKKIIPIIDSATDIANTLEWISSNPLIASVNNDGLVKALAPGTATITLRSIIDASMSAGATVTVPGDRVTGIVIEDTTPIALEIGQHLTVPNVVRIDPAEATIRSFRWISSNDRVASVSGNEIVGVAGGTAYISAVTDDGGFISAQRVEVSVAPRLVSNIELSINHIDFRINDPTLKYSRTIYAEVTSSVEEESPTNGRLNWTSSNPKVALVRADGTVIAIGEGDAVITAATVDGSNVTASCQVNVAQVRVDSLQAMAYEGEMAAGATRRLAVNILPYDAANKKLIWTSSDEAVATVDQTGLVTMHSHDPNATVTITVTSADNPLAQASYEIVTRISLLDIRMVDKSDLEMLRLNGTKPIGDIEFYPTNATNRNYSFVNINPDIISVDEANGTVTGLQLGVGILQVKSEDGGLVDTIKIHVKDAIKSSITLVDKNNPANSANITGKVRIKGFDDVDITGGKADIKLFPDMPDDVIHFEELALSGSQTVYRNVDVLQRNAFGGSYTVFLDVDDGKRPYFKMLTLHEKYYTTGNSILKEKNVEKYYDLLSTDHATDRYSKSRLFASIEWGDLTPEPLTLDREFATYTLGPNYENIYKSPKNQNFYTIFEYTYGDTFMKLGDGTVKRINWQFKPYGSYMDSMALTQLAINLADNPDSAFKKVYNVNLPSEVPIVASINGGHIEMAFMYQAPRLTEYGVAMNNNNAELVAKIRAYVDSNGSRGELEQVKKSYSGLWDHEASFESNLFYAGYLYGDFAFEDNIRNLRKWTFWNDRIQDYETHYYLGRYELWEDEYKLLFSRYGRRGIPVQELVFRVSASKVRAAQHDKMVVNEKYSLMGYNFVINAAFETNMDMKLRFATSNDQLQYEGREYTDSYAYVYTGFGKSVVSGGPYCDGIMTISVDHPNPGYRKVYEKMRAGNQVVILGIRKNFKTADYSQDSYYEKLPDGTSRKVAPSNLPKAVDMQPMNIDAAGAPEFWDGFMPIERASYAAYANNSGGTERTIISNHKETTEFKMTSGYGWLEPQLVKFGEKQMLIWADDNPNRASMDKIALQYSVYDKQSDSWSEAKYVNDDGTLDGRFSAGVSAGKVYLVQENAAAPVADGTGMAELLQGMRIELLTYDETTDSFSTRVLADPGTETSTIVFYPEITTTDSEVVATWLSNDAGNLFGTSGTNQLHQALLTAGMLRVNDVHTFDKPVISYATGLVNEGGSLNTAWLQDEDADLSTMADRAVYLKQGDQDTVKIVQGETLNAAQERTVDYPLLANVNGKLSLFWYNSNGNIYYLQDVNDPSIVQSVFSRKILPENFVQEEDQPLAREYPATPEYNLIEGEDGSIALVYNVGKGILQNDGTITQGADTHVVFYDFDSRSFAGYTANLSKSGAYIGGTEGFIDEEDGSFNIAMAEKTNYDYNSEVMTSAKLKTMKVIPTVDLEAEEGVLYCDSDTIVEGQNLSANVYVKNVGELQAEGIKITLTDGLGYSSTTEFADAVFAPEGETKVFTVTYPVPQPLTQRTLTVLVEPLNEYQQDYVLANNTATKVIGGIDLKITEMTSRMVDQYMAVNATVANNTGKDVPESSLNLYEYDRSRESVKGTALQTIPVPALEAWESQGFSLMFDTNGINFNGDPDKAYVVRAEVPGGLYDVKNYNNERTFAVINPYYGKIPFSISVSDVSLKEDAIEIELVAGNKLPIANSGSVSLNLVQSFEDPANAVVPGEDMETEISQKVVQTNLSAMSIDINDIPAYGTVSQTVSIPFDPDNLNTEGGYTNIIHAEFTSAAQGTPLTDEADKDYYSNSTFTKLDAFAKSSNKEVESLVITGASFTPVFSNEIAEYALTGYQPNTDLELTVTVKAPPSETEPEPLISYSAPSTDGQPKYLLSGEAQAGIELDYSETLTVTITANDGSANTFTFRAPARPSSGGGSSSGTQPKPPVSEESGGTVTGETTVSPNNVLVIKVSENDIIKAIENLTIDSVTIAATGTGTEGAQVKLTGQTVKTLENNALNLTVETGDIKYVIPASEFSIEQTAQSLGVAPSDLTKVEVSINITNVSDAWMDEVKDKIQLSPDQILIPPVNFEITCETENADGSTSKVTIDRFSNYVERMIKIPEGVDPNQVTTGVVIHADGTVSHVPTTITVIDGVYYAVINSLTNSIYSLIYNKAGFSDVKGHWSQKEVEDMASRMVVSGVSSNIFEPDRDITRAEFTAILIRGLGLLGSKAGQTAFKDVAAGAWFTSPIAVASHYELIAGYGNGSFGPNDRITREQAMTIIARAMKLTRLEEKLNTDNKTVASFTDGKEISPWAVEAIEKCSATGIVMGSNNMILPRENLTRAQTVVMISRLLGESELI